MYLSEVFDALSHGELSQLYVGGEDDGVGIDRCDYPKIVSHINLALSELYKRFPIKTGEVRVIMYDQLNKYRLDPRFAHTNEKSSEPIKYIADSLHQPFKGGVNKIEIVYDEGGEEMYLNDDTRYWSLYTPEYNVLQVPWPDRDNSYTVHYRANHDKILIPGLNPETEQIFLPPGYLEPLLFYVGSRTFTAMNGDSDSEGNNYMAKFEQSCARIRDLNLTNDDNTTNEKLDRAGWV